MDWRITDCIFSAYRIRIVPDDLVPKYYADQRLIQERIERDEE